MSQRPSQRANSSHTQLIPLFDNIGVCARHAPDHSLTRCCPFQRVGDVRCFHCRAGFTSWQMRLLDTHGNFKPAHAGVSQLPSTESAIMLLQQVVLKGEISTTSFKALASRRRYLISLGVAALADLQQDDPCMIPETPSTTNDTGLVKSFCCGKARRSFLRGAIPQAPS